MIPPPAASGETSSADDARWFSDEVHSHDAALKAYLRGSFPDVRDVDDVVQESYLRIWKSRAASPIRSAKGFLFTIARRLALDFVRRGQRSPFVAVKACQDLFVLDEAPDARDQTTTADDVERLVDAIESLPARCREIFVLCHIEGRSHKEVAARLGIAESTVGVQSARGLQRCEALLRGRVKAE